METTKSYKFGKRIMSIFSILLYNYLLMGQAPASFENKTTLTTTYDYRVEELKVRWKKAAVENCAPCPVTPSVPTVTCGTGKVWMDRNLGASQVATSITDAASYGDLYQWGRGTDGHQIRTSAQTGTLSSTDSPGNNLFIYNNASPWDWRSGQNDLLWQGVSGINNPCPSGFRVPTETELNAERLLFSPLNAAGAFASCLKMPAPGYRFNTGLQDVGVYGYYWTSTVSGFYARFLDYYGTFSSNAKIGSQNRNSALSVRCIKD